MNKTMPRRCWRGWITLIVGFAAIALTSCTPPKGNGSADRYRDDLLNPKDTTEYKGVVLASHKGTLPVEGKPCDVAVGEVLVVRVRNLDGWLIDKLLDNRITGEPAMTGDQRRDYVLLHQAKGNESSESFIKRYENAATPKLAAPGETEVAASFPLKPLPEGLTPKRMRDAKNGYDSLLATVKRQVFLVINNSQFLHIKADNADEGMVSSRVKTVPGNTVHEFEFSLRRVTGDEDAWSALYDGTRAVHDVRVSVGLKLDDRVFVLDTMVFPQTEAQIQHVRLQLFDDRWLNGVLLALVVLLAGIVGLGAKTSLLRDSDLPLRADGCAQFSLSRLQLAFWTYLVVGAFLIIWLVTDRLDTLNTTILALLGISSGTTLASKLANTLTLTGGATSVEPRRAARRNKSIEELRESVDSEIRALETEAAALEEKRQATAKPSPELEAKAVTISARLQRLHDDHEYLNHNALARFCIDLLSENGRVTLHRFQVVVWTVVLGVVFITKVKRELAMPVFSETLLGLMGLSSLTYVALKVPELKQVQAQVNAVEPGTR
jgi:hypothetical protein